MARKALWLLPASLAALTATQWKDIARLLKIHQMSRGTPSPTAAPNPTADPTPGAFREGHGGAGQRNSAL